MHPCIHASIHPSMHVCIKICSIVLYQMAPSTWKVQPRKRENHCSVPAAPQNSQQRNVDFVVFVAALFLWSSFPGSLSMARRNARSDPPPHRRWRRVLNSKSKSWPNICQAQDAQLQKPRPRSPDYPLSISPPGTAHSAGPASR